MVSLPTFTSTTTAWCGIGRLDIRARGTSLTEGLLQRERWIVLSGLAVIAVLSWVYILTGARTGMSVKAMTVVSLFPHRMIAMHLHPTGWSSEYWIIMLLMWWVMMIAMMTPSAAPMILLYARVTRYAQSKSLPGPALVPAASFAGGYLLAWLGFSVVATASQRGLEVSGGISPMWMSSTSAAFSAAVLISAGAYQLSRWKHRCLNHCRASAAFLSRHNRPGRLGALRMGIEHGALCVGCCWGLMALLFVGGIMNVLWISILAIIVLVEKLTPQGLWFARVTGMLLIVWGAATLAV